MTKINDKNVPKLRFPDFTEAWGSEKAENLYKSISTKPHQILASHFEKVGDFPVVDQGKEKIAGYTSVADKAFTNLPVIVFGDHTTELKFIDIPFVVGADGTKILKPKSNSDDTLFHFFALCKYNVEQEGYKRHFSILKDQKIWFPKLSEQLKIARFLGAVDAKIEHLTKRRALLEDYKKGRIQQLFSQEIRFKDEDGKDFPDWQKTTLGKVVTFLKGKGVSKANISENGATPCIRYGEIYTLYSEHITEVHSSTDVARSELFMSMAGDVINPASGEDPLDMARACCVESAGIALGGDINVLRGAPNGIFLAYYLNNAKRKEIAGFAQGNSVVHLYGSQLSQLSVAQPHPNEQRKIANFLSAIDIKLEQFSKELIHARMFKQGLLQQLFV